MKPFPGSDLLCFRGRMECGLSARMLSNNQIGFMSQKIMNPCRIERTTQICSDGLDATGRKYLVSTGRFALRGIGRAQDLYTLDPDVGADEVVAGSYERYLAP